MAISSIGVGSGLPLAELLQNLRISEEQALKPLEDRQAKTQSRISGYGQLRSELDNLTNAAKALQGPAFQSMKTSVTGNDFTATARNGAAQVTYAIQVHALAKAQSLVTTGVASRSEDIGTGGVIQFTINGETKELDLTGKGTSLNDLISHINKDPDLGVQASILNDGSGNRLVLSAKKTGTDAAVTQISVTGNADLQDLIGFGQPGSTVQENAAANAELTINGVQVFSQSNTVDKAINDITLQLTGASGDASELKVENDVDALTKAIETFVNAYNDVHKKIRQLTKYDQETQTGAALVGDSVTRSIQNRLAGVLNSVVDGPFSMLSQIGIRTQEGGLLGLDKTKLAEAINSNREGVRTLFAGENGIAHRAQEATEIFTDKYKGILVTSEEGANKLLDSLNKEHERALERIEARMEIHRVKFAAMDSFLAQMNSTSAYLAQQLANLGGNKK